MRIIEYRSGSVQRRGYAIDSLLLICALLINCMGISALASPVNGPTNVRIGSFSKAVDYAPYLVAKNKGWFEAALKPLGASPSYEFFQSLPSINEAFASNRLDVVFEAEAPAIVGKAAGIDLKIVGVSARLALGILVHKNAGILKVSDLRGKKIAVLAGTSAHYGLVKILKENGLSKDDVSIMDMTPPDAKSAFESNRVDAWVVWPPFAQQEELSGVGILLPSARAQIQSIIVLRGGFMAEHHDLCKAILDQLQKAKIWVHDHPQQAEQIVASELSVPLPVIVKAWPEHNWLARIDDSAIIDMQDKADFLKNVHLIRNRVDVRHALIDQSIQSAKL